MAEAIDLDRSDRGNIYKEDADNVHAVELSLAEALAISDGEMPEELDEAIAEAIGPINKRTRRAYVIIKITSG